MTMRDGVEEWHQVTYWCTDWQSAEQVAVAQICPRLTDAEANGIIRSWWFVRKGPSWRLRARPAPHREADTAAVTRQLLTALNRQNAVSRWAASAYEPEIHAFGGTGALNTAHALFHADSVHLLRHLTHGGREVRRELGLLLPTALMRAAGQDWYEQGDAWQRVAAHRSPAGLASAGSSRDFAEAVRQLITASDEAAGGPLKSAPAWPTAWRHAGQELADLAQRGALTRGLRAILAHHILFAWNRLGIPAEQQHRLATAAGDVIFRHT